METLNAAYRSRMKMLHSYIAPSKKPQTSRQKKSTSVSCADQEIQEVVTVSIALFLGIPINDLLHMTLPELTLQQRFDNQLRLLRSQGMTQKQVAEAMGVSIHAIKGVGEKRYHSAKVIA